MWGWLVAPKMPRFRRRGGDVSAALSDVVVNGIKILLGQPVEGFFAERQPQFLQAIADMGTPVLDLRRQTQHDRPGPKRGGAASCWSLCWQSCAGGGPGCCGCGWCAHGGAVSTLCFVGYNLMLALELRVYLQAFPGGEPALTITVTFTAITSAGF